MKIYRLQARVVCVALSAHTLCGVRWRRNLAPVGWKWTHTHTIDIENDVRGVGLRYRSRHVNDEFVYTQTNGRGAR